VTRLGFEISVLSYGSFDHQTFPHPFRHFGLFGLRGFKTTPRHFLGFEVRGLPTRVLCFRGLGFALDCPPYEVFVSWCVRASRFRYYPTGVLIIGPSDIFVCLGSAVSKPPPEPEFWDPAGGSIESANPRHVFPILAFFGFFAEISSSKKSAKTTVKMHTKCNVADRVFFFFCSGFANAGPPPGIFAQNHPKWCWAPRKIATGQGRRAENTEPQAHFQKSSKGVSKCRTHYIFVPSAPQPEARKRN